MGNILEPKSTIRKLVSKVVRCGAVITTYYERPFRVSGERCPLADKEARSIQSDKESQTVSPLQSLSAVRPPSFSSYKLVFFYGCIQSQSKLLILIYSFQPTKANHRDSTRDHTHCSSVGIAPNNKPCHFVFAFKLLHFGKSGTTFFGECMHVIENGTKPRYGPRFIYVSPYPPRGRSKLNA